MHWRLQLHNVREDIKMFSKKKKRNRNTYTKYKSDTDRIEEYDFQLINLACT